MSQSRDSKMKLRIGYELQYEFPQATQVILMLNIHFTRVSDLAAPDHIIINPWVPISGYRDGFGNWCSRIVAPAGRVRISTDAVVNDTGLPDPSAPGANQVPVEQGDGGGVGLTKEGAVAGPLLVTSLNRKTVDLFDLPF